jgi:hypothetical protein
LGVTFYYRVIAEKSLRDGGKTLGGKTNGSSINETAS